MGRKKTWKKLRRKQPTWRRTFGDDVYDLTLTNHGWRIISSFGNWYLDVYDLPSEELSIEEAQALADKAISDAHIEREFAKWDAWASRDTQREDLWWEAQENAMDTCSEEGVPCHEGGAPTVAFMRFTIDTAKFLLTESALEMEATVYYGKIDAMVTELGLPVDDAPDGTRWAYLEKVPSGDDYEWGFAPTKDEIMERARKSREALSDVYVNAYIERVY